MPTTAPTDKAKPSSATNESTHKTAVPIAHAAGKKLKSHGQTIAIAGKHRSSASPSMVTPAATPTATIATPTGRGKLAANAAPSTAHGSSHHGRDLGIALGAIAVAMIGLGAWRTRRRLRSRSHPA